MTDFVTKLSCETWDTILDRSDTDSKFNCFQNTYLRMFYSFPLTRVKSGTKNKTWLILGLKTLVGQQKKY